MAKDIAIVVIRLMPTVDARFREHISHRGDVASFICAALNMVNLKKVPTPTVRFWDQPAHTTVCKLPKIEHDRLKEVAAARGCSMNALLNGVVLEYAKILKQDGRTRAGKGSGR